MGALLLDRARESVAGDTIPEEFGWIALLTPGNLKAFETDLARAKATNLSNEAVVELLGDWRATAELDGSPEALREIRREKKHQSISGFVKT